MAEAAEESEDPVSLHLFHRWGPWIDGEATHDSPLFPRLGTWTTAVQVRRCETCGKAKVRDIT